MKRIIACIALSVMSSMVCGMDAASDNNLSKRCNAIISKCLAQDDQFDDLESFLEKTHADVDHIMHEMPGGIRSDKTIGSWLEEMYKSKQEDIHRRALRTLHRVEAYRTNTFMGAGIARDPEDWLMPATVSDTDDNVLALARHCLTSNARHPEFEAFLKYTDRDLIFKGRFTQDRSLYEQFRTLPIDKAPNKKYVLEQLANKCDPTKASLDREFNEIVTECVEGKGGFGVLEGYLKKTNANADQIVYTATGQTIAGWLQELHDTRFGEPLQNVKKVLLRVSPYRTNTSYTNYVFERAQDDWLQPGKDTDDQLSELLSDTIRGAARLEELKNYLGKAERVIDIDKLSYASTAGVATSIGQTLDELAIKNGTQALEVLKLVYTSRADKHTTLRALVKALIADKDNTTIRSAATEWYAWVAHTSDLDKIPLESNDAGCTLGKALDNLQDPSILALFGRAQPSAPKSRSVEAPKPKSSRASQEFMTRRTFALIGVITFFAFTIYSNYAKNTQNTKKDAEAA